MKTAKELLEKLKSDEAFAKEFSEELKAKSEAGAKNAYEVLIPAAAEHGYELTEKDVDELVKAGSETISEEELGKVAGGTIGTVVVSISVFSVLASVVVSATEFSDEED